jgi:uncharacterized protein
MVFAAHVASAEPAIWLVQSPTAKVYLFGTMHILPKDGVWFGPKIAKAFADSSELWEEADVGLLQKQGIPNIMDQAIAPHGDLWAQLPPATATKFRGQLKSCHLPITVVAHFRPWFASMLPTICQLTEQSKGTLVGGANGPEGVFLTKAKAADMETKFFETAAQQIGYLADAPESVQLKQLRQAIDEGGPAQDEFAGMESTWLAGDVKNIAAMVAKSRNDDPDFYTTIFSGRNERFAVRIEEMLRAHEVAFVAIGAGHLAGPDSVQTQLEKSGIVAKRL